VAETVSDTRIPRQAIADAITEAMAGHDYTTVTEWVKPESCPCRQSGAECTMTEYLIMRTPPGCQGQMLTDKPLPAGQSIAAAELVSSLPQPDQDGTVSGAEVASVLEPLIRSRLDWNPYRRNQLARRLAEAFGTLEDASGQDARDIIPVSVLVCQWCSQPIPLARGPRARYCKNSHTWVPQLALGLVHRLGR
jgi:hypothetical protein